MDSSLHAPETAFAVDRTARREAGAVRLERISDIHWLEMMRPEWERLWRASPGATPFQSPRWLIPWWRHVGEGALAALAVRSAASGELVAFAPLYMHADASGVRTLFPLGIATTDDLHPLVKPGWEVQAIGCVAEWMSQAHDEWELLEWAQLPPGSPVLKLRVPPAWQREVVMGEPSPLLVLKGGVRGGPPAEIPSSMAENLRYCRSRAARSGSLQYECAGSRNVDEFVETLALLHGKRWARRGEPGVLADSRVLAWHREAIPQLHEAGMLRLYGLRLDGELIAVLYCLADGAPAREPRRHHDYIGGFDPRFSALSPGTLLVGYAIEQAAGEGAQGFDFLRGAEAYKYRWGATDRPMYTLRVFRGGNPARAA